MVDEIDKAPTEVVCILKSLLEDEEILLPDGRRFVGRKSPLYNLAIDAEEEDKEISISNSNTVSGNKGDGSNNPDNEPREPGMYGDQDGKLYRYVN